MTKWCNNCETYKESWEDQNFFPGYKYNVRCNNCSKWSLVYDSDKNLYDWWLNGIDSDQKNIIAKFGVDVSSSSRKRYNKMDLWKLWYWSEIFERNQWSTIDSTANKVNQMNFLSSWWNNNLLIIIDSNSSGKYAVHLIIYEMPMQSGDPSAGLLEEFHVSNDYSYFSDARNRVRKLENTLRGDHPILYNEPNVAPKFLKIEYYIDHRHKYYPSIFYGAEVKRLELPYYSAKNNPDSYIKPLDIVKRIRRDSNDSLMVHACIYLGNKQVAHAKGDNRAEVDSWDNFFRVNTGGSDDKLLRYHPFIAFKKPEKIIEHIAKIEIGREKYFYEKSNFSVRRNNCENFANRCVLGLDFSELNDIKDKKNSQLLNVNEHLNRTDSVLSSLTKSCSQSLVNNKIREINEYRKRGNENRIERKVDREGIEMQNCIEVQPKDYRLNNDMGVFISNFVKSLYIGK